METDTSRRSSKMMRDNYGKKPTWDIYLGDELFCRLMTKTEAERVAFTLGKDYRVVKSDPNKPSYLIDKATVTTDVGGYINSETYDTPNHDCTEQIREEIEYFFTVAGVHDTLTIEVHECED